MDNNNLNNSIDLLFKSKLKIINFNIQKLTNLGKISEFFLHVKVSDAHIIILTEFDLPYSPHFLHQLHDFLQLHHFKLATPSQKRVGILVRTDLDYLTIQETDKITTNSLSIPHVKRYMTDITIQFHHTPIIILAVYVPVYQSSTSNPDVPLSQSDFLDSLYSILPSVQFQDLILAGDWNTAPLELPSTMTDINLHSKLSSLNIDDIYPTSSPKNKKVNFTNYSTSSSRGHRRLDRTYISHPLQVKCNCFYKTYQKFHFSTHLPTSVTFYFNKNSHFVQEHSQTLPSLFPGKNYKYREKIIFTEFLQDAKLLEYLFQPTNINSQNPLITYNAYVKAVQKRNKRVFYLINRYIPSPSTSSDSQSLINLQQLNNKNYLSNQNYDKLNKRFKQKLKQVTYDDDTISTTNSFLSKLYAAAPAATHHDNQASQILQQILTFYDSKKLTESEKSTLMKPITADELLVTLDNIIKRKSRSPGPDGITYYAWKKSWNYSSPFLLQLSKHLLSNQHPDNTHSVNHTLIRLLPKAQFDSKSPDPTHLRPISLINTTIRLFNNHMTQRFLQIITPKISLLQQAFMPDRTLHRQIFTTRLMVQKLSHHITNSPSPNSKVRYLTLLDMAKAFDSISHNYIYNILERMNFPLNFINYIRDQIGNNTAQLLNGQLVYRSTITINRGTRQGLPISPALFNLCIEPLIHQLYTNLQGYSIAPSQFPYSNSSSELIVRGATTELNPSKIKILAFADDLITFNNSFEDTIKTVTICRDFATVSGCSLNQQKTKIYCHDEVQRHLQDFVDEYSYEISIHDIHTSPVYLGVPLAQFDWTSKLSELENRFQKILYLDLTPLQRVTGVNAYIYPTLYHLDQHMPIPWSLVTKFTDTIEQAILKFLPITNITRLKSLLYVPQNQGGFGLTDLKTQLLGRRAFYIYDLIQHHQHPHPLYQIIPHYLQQLMNDIVSQNFQFQYIEQQIERYLHLLDTVETLTIDDFDIPGTVNSSTKSITTIPFYTLLSSSTTLTGLQHTPTYLTRYHSSTTSSTPSEINLSYYQRKYDNEKQRERIGWEYLRLTEQNPEELRQSSIQFPSSFISPEEPNDKKIYLASGSQNPSPYTYILQCLQAWHSLVQSKEPVSIELRKYSPEQYQHMVNHMPENFLALFQEVSEFSNHTDETINHSTFQHASKRLHNNKNYIPYVTAYWKDKLLRTEKQWAKYFKWLKEFRHTLPGYNTWFHFFQSGLLLNFHTIKCHLCNEQGLGPAGFQHAYFHCPIAQLVWTIIIKFPRSKLTLEFIVCNSNLTVSEISKINYYIAYLLYLKKQRYGLIHNYTDQEPLAPINAEYLQYNGPIFDNNHRYWAEPI